MALVQSLAKRKGQIKSRERVRDLAEVYTHEREVNAMLDLVSDMFPSARDPGNTDRTFLEPACGHGNFLVEILHRKLKYVTPRRYGRGERFEHRALRCLASVYGIDICDDNVRESRERMQSMVSAHVEGHLGGHAPTIGFSEAVEAILETNIIRGDTLADAAEIELVEYRAWRRGQLHPRVVSPRSGRERAEPLLPLCPPRRGCQSTTASSSAQPDPVTHDPVASEAA